MAISLRKIAPAWLGSGVKARLAALVGAVLLSLVTIVFSRCSDAAQDLFRRIDTAHPVLALVVPPVLFVVVVWATRRAAPLARGSGIPQVMAAVSHPNSAAATRALSLGTATVKFFGTLGILLAGGSAGREGPSVQIGAAVMRAVNRRLGVPVTSGIVIAGGAAGIAAAFNTPLAGIAFAIEELAAAFEQRVAMTVMATVMVAGLTSLSLDGDYVYFGAMTAPMAGPSVIVAALIAGLAGGVVGGLFAQLLIAFAWSKQPVFALARARPLRFAALCGTVVAITGYASGGLSWGTGYGTTRALLTGQSAPLLFGPAKLIATIATALSGAPGGIFAPSLSVGAGLGQVLSALLSPVLAHVTPGAMVLLGIAGYFTGVTRAPLTAVIIVMEMTADRGMILPLMATALVADGISAMVCRRKLYHALALQFH